MSKKLQRPVRIMMSVFVTIVLLIGLEWLIRVSGAADSKSEQLFTDIYSVEYEMLPNALNPWTNVEELLNGSGLRGREIKLEKPAGEFRIVTLGDSTTFGAKVETHQTFSYILEKQLRAEGINANVINGGLPGTNIWQQVLFFERKLAAMHPDLVIVYSGPNFRKDLYYIRHNMSKVPKHGMSQFALYRLLRRWIKPVSASGVYSQHVQAYFPDREPEVPEEMMVIDTREDLARLKQVCDRIGAKVVALAVMPLHAFLSAQEDGVGIDSPEWSQYYHTANLATLIPEQAKTLGIDTIELQNDFYQHFNNGELFADQVHLSPAGHKLMAELLDRELRKLNVLPSNLY